MNYTKHTRIILLLVVVGLFFSVAATAETILMIGDSHTVGEYGQNLKSQLESLGNVVIKRGVGGTGIHNWVVGQYDGDAFDNLQTLITSHNPTTVIISLGTNNYGDASADIERNARQLISVIPAGIRCFWVGPPEVRENPSASGGITNADVDKVYGALNSGVTRKCTLVDSRLYTDKNSPEFSSDGVHLTGNAAITWAGGVYHEITGLTAPTGAARGQGSAQTTLSITSQAGCTNPQQCREIDEVWQRSIGFIIRSNDQIWDVSAFQWRQFNVVYPTPLQERSGGAMPSGQGPSGPGSNAYDEIIREAATTFYVDPALIKAVIQAESAFNPSAQSPTGCGGLMQICEWDKYQDIRNRYQLSNDESDPRANIFVGTSILNSLRRYRNVCGVECQLAAYNGGGCIVEQAAGAVSINTGSGGLPKSWNNVRQMITPEILSGCGQTYNQWDQTQRASKVTEISNYPANVLRNYPRYQAEFNS